MSTLDSRLRDFANAVKAKFDALTTSVTAIGSPLTPAGYGAALDNSTDDHAAYVAVVAASKAQAGNTGGGGFYKGGPEIVLPAGKTGYMGANALDVNHTVRISGFGSGRFGPASRGGSAIRFAAGTSGVRVQSATTSGDTAITGDHDGAGGVNLEHLMFQGPEDATEASSDGSVDASLAGNNIGLDVRSPVTAYDLYIRGFRGIGAKGWAGTYNGTNYGGNVSLSAFYGTKIEGCQIAFDFRGADTNIVHFINSEAYQCTQAGFVFDVGIGPIIGVGLHTASNGMITGFLSYMCHHNGDGTDRRYAATWGKTIAELTANAPPNGPTSNDYWNYVEDGGTDSVVKTWDGVQQFRGGGDILTAGPVNPNQVACFIGAYSENPGVSQFGGSTLLISCDIVRKYRIGGVHIYAQNHSFICDESAQFGGSLTAQGFTHTLGDNASTTVSNVALNLDTTSTECAIFARYTGGVQFGFLAWEKAGPAILNAPTGYVFERAGTQIADLDNTGFNIASGAVYKVNNTQVVGARQTGTPADATDLATALTLVNALKAKLIAHGLIS